jgi:hypothetical protein
MPSEADITESKEEGPEEQFPSQQLADINKKELPFKRTVSISKPRSRKQHTPPELSQTHITILPGSEVLSFGSALGCDTSVHQYANKIVRIAVLICVLQLAWLFIYLFVPSLRPPAIEFWINFSLLLLATLMLLQFSYGGIVYNNFKCCLGTECFTFYRVFAVIGILTSFAFTLVAVVAVDLLGTVSNLVFLVLYLEAESRARILILLLSLKHSTAVV